MSAQADHSSREPAFTGPLVGRTTQMRTARAALESARRGRGQVLGLTGEPGIGKSRLAVEVLRLAPRLGFAVYRGACRDGASTAYLVWQPIWRGLLEVDPSLPVAEQQTRLAATVAERDGGSAERAPLLSPVLNVPMPDSQLTASLDLQARAEVLPSLLLDQLRACAAAAPLLLVLEDCHWIDRASQGLLELLARNAAEQPVLFVLTSRPVDATTRPFQTLAHLAHFTEVRVADLPADDAERLVAQRIRSLRGEDHDIPRDVVRQVVAWAGGNPFHLEELVSFLLAPGTDPREPRALAALDHPDDLRRLVLARTDQLGDDEKTTLEIASVVGPRFPASWIWGSYPAAGTPQQVLRQLEHLAELEFLRRRSPAPEPQYGFKHAITREAVYESLSAHRRETFHEAVARFIEQTYPDRLSQVVDILAHHYGQTPNRAKQRVWLRAAADAASKAFAVEAAIGHYERLLGLLSPEHAGELLIQLGDLLRQAARWADAERTYQQALQVAESTGDARVHAEANRGLGSVLPYTRPYGQALRQAVDQLRLAVTEFEQLQHGRGLAKTLERLAWTSWELGDYPGALAASDRHLAIATEANDLVGVSAALENMGVVRWRTGDYADALKLLQRALETANEAGYRPGVILAANDLASVRVERGDHFGAITHFRQALSVAQEIGDRRMTTLVVGNIGETYRRHGEYGRAIRCFAHAFRTAAEIGDRTYMANQAENLAMTVAAQGREPEAEQLLVRAIELARQLDAQFYLCEWLYQHARLLAAAGRLHEAERANREALELAPEHHPGIELPARLLSLRLRVDLASVERGVVIRELRALRDHWVEPPEQALLLDALWQLDPTQEQARRDAAQLFRMLYERAPTVEYRLAHERLTGMALPLAPPLPAAPEGIGRQPLDLDEVLEQLDLVTGQILPEVARNT